VNILGQIGKTPLLKLHRVIESPDVEIFVKCEFMNPGGSIKDRMALSMVEAAEERGELKKGGTIVDQSTGNTGPALAFVGAVKGYKVQLFLPAHLSSSYNPADRMKIARIFGCDVTVIDLGDDLEGLDELNDLQRAAAFVAIRMKKCQQLQESDSSVWWANQLCNPDNPKAHREGTGVEIAEQMDGAVDAWVSSIGTGGTILGVAEALRDVNPDLIVSGVVPDDDPRIEWVRSGAVHHLLNQVGMPQVRFLIEDLLEKQVMDHEMTVNHEEAKHMADRLSREEGLFCGMSSGANVHAALQLARNLPKGSRVATVLVDRRDRYLTEYPSEQYVV